MATAHERLSFHVASAWDGSVYPGPTPEETGFQATFEVLESTNSLKTTPKPEVTVVRTEPTAPPPPPVSPSPRQEPTPPVGLFDLPALLNRLWALPAAQGPAAATAFSTANTTAVDRAGPAARGSDPIASTANASPPYLLAAAPTWGQSSPIPTPALHVLSKPWTCPSCHFRNPPWARVCPDCRAPSPEV